MRRDTSLAELRTREFSRLDATGSVYLDYTGSALYPEPIIQRDAIRLTRGVFGNPHSAYDIHSSGSVSPAARLPRAETVEAAAHERSIAIRGGCFCNPGAAEHAFGINEAGAFLPERRVHHSAFPKLHGESGGRRSSSASTGIPTTAARLDRLIECVVNLTE